MSRAHGTRFLFSLMNDSRRFSKHKDKRNDRCSSERIRGHNLYIIIYMSRNRRRKYEKKRFGLFGRFSGAMSVSE